MPSKEHPGRILLLDDERALREMAALRLRQAGHDVDDVPTLEQALSRLRTRPYDVVVSDLILDVGTGFDLLDAVREESIPVEVIIMTGQGGVAEAVDAIRRGAYDFVTKPLIPGCLEQDVARALEKRRLEQDLERLSGRSRGGFGALIGHSPAMARLFELLERAAGCESNVLLLGESGTGKEVAAREIHAHSARADGPFVPINCGALPPELLESELFGHRRGAFTGAATTRKGLFLAAGGGTLFLDEIGTAPPRVQVGLLRAIQERRIRPVGGDEDVAVDVRLIAATNADLDELIAEGKFRKDLYYRLATLVVEMPPLRARREDIAALAGLFLERLAGRGARRVTLSGPALDRLSLHDWPGNVRELEHLLERVTVTAKGTVVDPADLPLPEVVDEQRIPTLEEVERRHLRQVLDLCHGNKKKAARLLAIPRATLYRKIERYGLDGPSGVADRQPAAKRPGRPAGSRPAPFSPLA